MDSWIWQPGYPLVSARVAGDELVLSQRRFSFDPEFADATLWSIPIRVRHTGGTVDVLLEGDEVRLPVADGPIIVNADGHGFFRVDYADALRDRLTTDVVHGMSTLERYNLVDDAWSAVSAGAMTAAEFVALIERFEGEREFGVWQALAIGLRGIRRLLPDKGPAVEAYRRIVHDLAGPALAELGDPVAGESDLTAKARGLLLGLLAVQGADEPARARAREIYEGWATDPSSVDAELAASATGIMAATGDADMYDRFLSVVKSGATPQDQLRHLYLLGEFDDAELMQRTCEFAMSSAVKSQNAPFLLRMCIGNRTHGAQAWAFLQQHWGDANEKFPRNTIVRMIETVKLLDRPEQVAATRAFFSEHPIEQAVQTLEQTLERQQVNARVREDNADALARSLIG
jgi:puromycin-sensitive aminopeptidase